MYFLSTSNASGAANKVPTAIYGFAASVAYASGDQLGVTNSIYGPAGAETLFLKQFHIYDLDNLKTGLSIFLYSENPGTGTDNSAITFASGVQLYEIAKITVLSGDYDTKNSIAVAHVNDLNIPLPVNARKPIYAVFRADAAATYTGSTKLLFGMTAVEYE